MSVCSKICDCESQDQKEFKLPSELDFGNKYIYIYIYIYISDIYIAYSTSFSGYDKI